MTISNVNSSEKEAKTTRKKNLEELLLDFVISSDFSYQFRLAATCFRKSPLRIISLFLTYFCFVYLCSSALEALESLGNI